MAGLALAAAATLALSACGSDGDTASASADAPTGITCADGTFNAAGSSAQQNAITAWTNAYQAPCGSTTLNYNPTGSGAGITSFTQGQIVFAGSDSALKPEEKTAADARCKTGEAVDLPMVVGPIAVGYNVKGVDNLQLSPKTIAEIFAGKVTTWDDAAIKADNPDATLPSTAIQTYHRNDDSGTTDNFTKYLTATAPDVWTFEGGKKWTAPGGNGVKGSDGVATAVSQTDGAIGYMELSFAKNQNIATAKVKNGAGEYVALTPEAAGITVASAKQTGTGDDLALKIDYTTTAPGAYPLVLVTYEITCVKGLAANDAAFVKSFLGYTSGSQGQGLLTENGYAPLPASVQAKTAAVVAKIS
jgi:phosphate transport system substrate-binding protein